MTDVDTGEMDFPDCDRKIEIGGRYVKVRTAPCDIAIYFHRNTETGQAYLVIDVDDEDDDGEWLPMKLYRNNAPVYTEGLYIERLEPKRQVDSRMCAAAGEHQLSSRHPQSDCPIHGRKR